MPQCRHKKVYFFSLLFLLNYASKKNSQYYIKQNFLEKQEQKSPTQALASHFCLPKILQLVWSWINSGSWSLLNSSQLEKRSWKFSSQIQDSKWKTILLTRIKRFQKQWLGAPKVPFSDLIYILSTNILFFCSEQ